MTLLGLDLGTSSVKVILVDEAGRTMAEAGAACEVDRPWPCWAEADPERWWKATVAVFLPYLTGERTPWMDPHVRSAWAGLGACDGPGTLMRAALVGVAFGIRAGLDALRDEGASVKRLRLAGGGTVHQGWRQILADVLRVPLDAVACPHASARGAALLGGLAAGIFSPADLPALAPAADRVASPRETSLDHPYARFRDLYARLAPWTRP